jgi:hypothetical protein
MRPRIAWNAPSPEPSTRSVSSSAGVEIVCSGKSMPTGCIWRILRARRRPNEPRLPDVRTAGLAI